VVVNGHCECVPRATTVDAVAVRDAAAVGSCGVPTTHRCNDHNNLQVCNGRGAWTTLQHCFEDKHEACYVDETTKKGGGCRVAAVPRDAPVLPEWFTAGELCFNTTRCNDNKVQHCPEPNTWTTKQECPIGQVCVQDCSTSGCTARCHATSSGPDLLYPDCVPGRHKCDYNLAVLLICNKFKQWQTKELCPKAGACKPGAVGEAHCERAEILPLRPSTSASTPAYTPPPSNPSSVASSSIDNLVHIAPVSKPIFTFKSSWAQTWTANASDSSSWTSTTLSNSTTNFSTTTSIPLSSSVNTDTVPHGPPPPVTQPVFTTTVVSLRSTSKPSSSVRTETVPHTPSPPLPSPTSITTVSSSSLSPCTYTVTNSNVPHGPPPPECFGQNTSSPPSNSTSLASTSTSTTSSSSVAAKPTSGSQICRAGESQCTANNGVEKCTVRDGVAEWANIKNCTTYQVCWDDLETQTGLRYAKCTPITELLREHDEKQRTGEPEWCDQPGNDRCVTDRRLDHIDSCFAYGDMKPAWWQTEQCPEDTECLASIDEASGTVRAACVNTVPSKSKRSPQSDPDTPSFGDCTKREDGNHKCVPQYDKSSLLLRCGSTQSGGPRKWYRKLICPSDRVCTIETIDLFNYGRCLYKKDDPRMPGRCQDLDKKCDGINLMKCDLKTLDWKIELACREDYMRPGVYCEETGYRRAMCPGSGYRVSSTPSPTTTPLALMPRATPPPEVGWGTCTEAEYTHKKCTTNDAGLAIILFCMKSLEPSVYFWTRWETCPKEQVCDLDNDGTANAHCQFPDDMPNPPFFCQKFDKLCSADKKSLLTCNNALKRWDLELVCTEGGECVEDEHLRARCTRGGVHPPPNVNPRNMPNKPDFCQAHDKICGAEGRAQYKCNNEARAWDLELICTEGGKCVEDSPFRARCSRGGVHPAPAPRVPGQCKLYDRKCSSDGRYVLMCNAQHAWVVEFACWNGEAGEGKCVVDGEYMARCWKDGNQDGFKSLTVAPASPSTLTSILRHAIPSQIQGDVVEQLEISFSSTYVDPPPFSLPPTFVNPPAWTTYSAAPKLRTAAPATCNKGDRVCDSARRFLFTCSPTNHWTTTPQRCFGPGWCKPWAYTPGPESLECAGFPQYVDTPTCDSRCEAYTYLYCEAGKKDDAAAVEHCRVAMCADEECRGCDRCTWKRGYGGGRIVPDMSTSVPGRVVEVEG